MTHTRREALTALGAVAAVPVLTQLAAAIEPLTGAAGPAPLIATNTYPWLTFARRAKREFTLHTDELLAKIASTGINGYEPIIEKPAEFDGLAERLKKHGLRMESLYVNSVLHDSARVEKSMQDVIAIAERAKQIGVKIIVTNPVPIRWGGTDNKTDAQLRLQGKSLNKLGAELRKRGLMLAYHNHDAELRAGGREFHHMLTSTSPENVKFCLDAHWVFRGCGDSEVAVFDALRQYHGRVVELHLRQSVKGVWTEAFAMKGDIDYARLFGFLFDRKIRPHLVLEQSIEDKTGQQLSVVDAHRAGQKALMAMVDRVPR